MIQSVSRAMDILTVVSDMRGEPVCLSIIARKTGIHLSTCAHLVTTLCEKGFLTQISRSAGYVLGAYTYYLARYKTFQKELVTTCNPALKWIQRKTGHSALLAMLIEGEKFVISYAEDSRDILHERGDLFRGNLYNTATGHALLAAMRQAELKKLVDKIGLPDEADWPGIDTFEKLKSNLERINQAGIVCIEKTDEQGYDALYGISIRAPRLQTFAVGLHVHQPEPPSDDAQQELKTALLFGVREINRRLRFEQSLQ